MNLIGAALGDHVHDAAESLSVLRFKTAGLHLDFLNKVEIDAVAEGAVYAAVGSKTAEARVGGVRAIDNVFVFKTGSAVDGRIRSARAIAVGDAGSHCHHRCNVSADGHILKEVFVEIAADSSRTPDR